MIRFLGIAFIFMASAFVGIYLSDNIKRKKERLVTIGKILSEISELIRCYSFTLSEISAKLSENNDFAQLRFIKSLSEEIKKNSSFPDAWKKAVEDDNALSNEEKKLLYEVGMALGTTDIEGQVSALEFFILQAEKMAEEENERYKVKGKMYRSLGAVFGAMIGILII